MASVTGFTAQVMKGMIGDFQTLLAPLNAFSLTVENAEHVPGDVIQVGYSDVSDAASTFSYDTGFNATGSRITNKNITLSDPVYYQWAINDSEFKRLNTAGEDAAVAAAGRHGRNVANKMAATMYATLFTNITSSNFSNSSAVSGSDLNTNANLAVLQKECDTLNFPIQRSIIANPACYAAIASNNSLIASGYGDPSVIRSGRVTEIMGFNAYMVQNFPSNGADGLMGAAIAPEALLVALGDFAPQPGHNYTAVYQVTEPTTGLNIFYREYYLPDYASARRVFSYCFGAAVGNSSGVVLIKTTP